MQTRPLGRSIHVALAVPSAACVAPALLFDYLGGMHRDTVFVAMTAAGAFAALTWTVVVTIGWCARRGRLQGRVPGGSRFETVLALLTGLSLGAYAGVMQEVELFGLHFSAGASYFLLLPLAILVCCPRSPGWRPFLDITVLMAGMEVGAQTGMMLTKWKDFRWWDDVTGIDLAYWAGGMVAATIWALVRRTGVSPDEEARIRIAVHDGEPLPPRKS